MSRITDNGSRSNGSTAAADASTASSRQSRNLAARMGRWSAEPLEDRDVRLARVRPRRIRDRRRRRDEDDRPEHAGAGRVRPHGQDPRRRLQAARRRERPRPERARCERATRPSRPRSQTSSPGSPKLDVVQNVRSPLDPGNAGQIAKSGHAALVEFEIRGDPDEAADKIAPVLDRVDEAAAGPPGALHRRVRRRELGRRGRDRLRRTTSARPGCSRSRSRCVILVIAFGALVAAGIPLLLALTAVFATFGLIALPSHVLPLAHAGSGARAPDRARGRRRLLDVLLEARTRGAGRRAQRARRRSRPPPRHRAARCSSPA